MENLNWLEYKVCEDKNGRLDYKDETEMDRPSKPQKSGLLGVGSIGVDFASLDGC